MLEDILLSNDKAESPAVDVVLPVMDRIELQNKYQPASPEDTARNRLLLMAAQNAINSVPAPVEYPTEYDNELRELIDSVSAE
jgi:hypothetical protein